jgi:hypothetical protein
MCQGGNCRSVACAYLLKYKYGMDALACSWEANSADTLKMLFQWADAIIVMEGWMKKKVPTDYHSKVFVIDVGQDVWMNGLHPDLIAKVDIGLAQIVKPARIHA